MELYRSVIVQLQGGFQNTSHHPHTSITSFCRHPHTSGRQPPSIQNLRVTGYRVTDKLRNGNAQANYRQSKLSNY
jgi:hypothetical protein